ncbi:acyl-coenzyme A synthetase/AMP-(fatty) acid ligase [Nocardia sp. GAS34]|uniref:AMP-binding protein n=1 Tax=unclassified Nocardia TaxID=2637762 RepID=UPI003D1E252B
MIGVPADAPAAPSEPVGTGNLAGWLEDLARGSGWLERTAYIQGAHRFTYGELYAEACRRAEALRRLGVSRGSRVLLALPDGIDFVTTFLAVLRVGGVAIPVDEQDSDGELRDAERAAEATLVVAGVAVREAFEGHTVTLRDLGDPGERVDGDAGPEPMAADDPAFAVVTAGAAGARRLRFHSHGAAVRVDRATEDVLAVSEGEVCYSAAPMHLEYGLGNAVLLPLRRGAAAVLTPQRPDEGLALSIVLLHRVGVFCAEPVFYARMLTHPHAGRLSRLRLALVVGQKLPLSLAERLRRMLGRRLVDLFEIG